MSLADQDKTFISKVQTEQVLQLVLLTLKVQ